MSTATSIDAETPQHSNGRGSPADLDSSSAAASDDDNWVGAFAPACTATSVRRLSVDSRVEGDQSTAATLPSELILEIFQSLTSTRDLHSTLLTCRSWCECSVQMLWHKPSIYTPPSLLKLLETMRMGHLTFEYALFIRRLSLSYVYEQVADSILLSLQCCRKLERITLVNCRRVTDRGLCDVLTRNPGLIALDLTNLELITDLSILVASSRNKLLQGLNLSGCSKITDDSITNIAKGCPQLRRIKLNNCSEIRDRSVSELARNSHLLLEVDLDHCHQVTSTSVSELIHRCKELRELRLNMCSQIDDYCFSNMEKDRYVNLRSLDLTGCSRITDESVYHIVTAAPRLRTLVLAKCPNITDRGAVQIARLGKNIHFLHLGHCSQLTDRCVSFLAKYCNRLRYIDLACCIQLTDAAVVNLAELPRLKRIGLVKCSEITPEAIFALVEKRTVQYTLERIHLSYCINLQLHCIRDLLNACKRLTHISLTGVPAFLRHDLTQFCRPSPREFNTAQASVFCVFSAGGVIKLRNHLNQMVSLHESLPGELRMLEDMSILEEEASVAAGEDSMDEGPGSNFPLG